MATFKVTKSWTETQTRVCSRTVSIQAESEEDAIELAESTADGPPDYEGDWAWDDNDPEDEADWEAELDEDSEAEDEDAEEFTEQAA
jgi:hypothetical protein